MSLDGVTVNDEVELVEEYKNPLDYPSSCLTSLLYPVFPHSYVQLNSKWADSVVSVPILLPSYQPSPNSH